MKAPVPYPVYPGLPPRRAQSFTAVALLLTNGTPPPEWLIPELERLSPIIGYHRTASPRDEAYDKEMIFAAKNLEQHLRTIVIAEEEFELGVTDCVETVLISLPEVIEFLEAQLRPPRKGGQIPDGRKRVCAGVCADCWRRLHGAVQPSSPKLQAACEEYWQTCGHPGTSTASNLKHWKRYLEEVADVADDDSPGSQPT